MALLPHDGPPSPQPQRMTPRRASPWRALLLGMGLIPVNAFWVTTVEVRWYTLDGTSLPLFITPIFFLSALAVVNLLWRRLARRPGRH